MTKNPGQCLKIVSGVAFLLMYGNFARADCHFPNLPHKFSLNEKFLALSTKFNITSGTGSHGTVTERIISLTTTFDYTDEKGSKLATARKALFSWGTQILVYDCEGKKIGTIREQIFTSMLKVMTVYSILDRNDEQVASSTKIDIAATNFTLTDHSGRKVATLDRPYFRLNDKWTVNVHDSSSVDLRLIVMIGAYKTAADNKKD